MKTIRRIIYLVLIILLCVAFVSIRYSSHEDPVQKDIENIQKVADIFEDELADFGVDKEIVDDVIAKIEEYNKETKYIIVFNIKNDTNPILSTTLHLPVNEEFFNSVEIGDKISEEEIKKLEELANLGQNFGSWTITIKDKEIRE